MAAILNFGRNKNIKLSQKPLETICNFQLILGTLGNIHPGPLDPVYTRDPGYSASEKFFLLQIPAAILNFVGNQKCFFLEWQNSLIC